MGGTFVSDGLWRSLDGGDSWTQLGTTADLITSDQGRMALAIWGAVCLAAGIRIFRWS